MGEAGDTGLPMPPAASTALSKAVAVDLPLSVPYRRGPEGSSNRDAASTAEDPTQKHLPGIKPSPPVGT